MGYILRKAQFFNLSCHDSLLHLSCSIMTSGMIQTLPSNQLGLFATLAPNGKLLISLQGFIHRQPDAEQVHLTCVPNVYFRFVVSETQKLS